MTQADRKVPPSGPNSCLGPSRGRRRNELRQPKAASRPQLLLGRIPKQRIDARSFGRIVLRASRIRYHVNFGDAKRAARRQVHAHNLSSVLQLREQSEKGGRSSRRLSCTHGCHGTATGYLREPSSIVERQPDTVVSDAHQHSAAKPGNEGPSGTQRRLHGRRKWGRRYRGADG